MTAKKKTPTKKRKPRAGKRAKFPLSHYAEQYGVNKVTISRWITKGINVDDPSAVVAFRASKDHGGAKSPSEKEPNVGSEAWTFPTEGEFETATLEGGAAATLARLETAEKNAYLHFQWAMQTGDAYKIKTAREGWLKLSDSLRRYDLMVEESRREKGALLPKEEAERFLCVLAYYIRIAGRQLILGSADKLAAIDRPETLAAALEELLGEKILLGIASLVSTSEGDINVPDWVAEALNSDLQTYFRDADKQLAARVAALKQAAATIAKKKGTKCTPK